MASLDEQTVDVPVTLRIGDGDDAGSVELGTLAMELRPRHGLGDELLVELCPVDGRSVEHNVADLLEGCAARFREPGDDDDPEQLALDEPDDEPGRVVQVEPCGDPGCPCHDEPAKGAADDAAPGR